MKFVDTGNATAIIVGGILYLIIFFQRKNTATKRDDTSASLQKQIDELKKVQNEFEIEKQLMQKDIDHLKDENIGIKEDIKEIKDTLHTIALAMERIATKLDEDKQVNMLKQFLKESTTFYTKEDNPLFYIFIIPKLVKSDVETVKQDEVLKNLINYVEEVSKPLAIANLKKKYSPIFFMNLFGTESIKKNMVEYINQYLCEFETEIANDEKDFMEAYKIHNIFSMIKNSDVFKAYLKSI